MGDNAVPLDYKQLKEVCIADFDYFRKLGEVRQGRSGEHIFIDNHADILFVAHLDTVSPSKLFGVAELDSGMRILSRAMDDRLGAYIGNWWLPQVGIVMDVLFTDGEESGRSTADDFVTDKQYNWMCQFDRQGVETVLYEYDCPELRKLLATCGIKVGHGSFTDICKLQHLGCKGINFATGYYDPHGEWANAHVPTLVNMVNQFIHFYTMYKDQYLPHAHEEKKSYQQQWGYSQYRPPVTPPVTTGENKDTTKENESKAIATVNPTGNGHSKDTPGHLRKNATSIIDGLIDNREMLRVFESTPPGYYKCSSCGCDVYGEWMLAESSDCMYCESLVIPEMRWCEICNKSSRITGFDGEGRCIYCVRTLHAHGQYHPQEEIIDQINDAGYIPPASEGQGILL